MMTDYEHALRLHLHTDRLPARDHLQLRDHMHLESLQRDLAEQLHLYLGIPGCCRLQREGMVETKFKGLTGLTIHLDDLWMFDDYLCGYRKGEVHLFVLTGEKSELIRKRCKGLKRGG